MINLWENYIESLCRKYRPLGHLIGDKRAWIPYGTTEAAPEKGNLKALYVKHQNIEVQSLNQTAWRYTSTLQVLQQVNLSKGNTEATIRAARQTTLNTAQALEARLIADVDAGVNCNWMEDIGEAQLTPVDLTDQSAYGWEMVITFVVSKREIEEEDWLE